jgi:hypothetical protein
MRDDDGIVLTSTEGEFGRVQVALYERHAPDQVGNVMRHELTVSEMEHLHTLLTRALWSQIRNMT